MIVPYIEYNIFRLVDLQPRVWDLDTGVKALWQYIGKERGNMDGLYANIRKDRKGNRDVSLVAIIMAILVIAVVVLVAVTWCMGYRRRFNVFVGNLSNSTTYAYEHESLTARIDGRLYKISEENMYGIFAYIALNKSGRESREIPEGEPVALEYGDGSVLRLWDRPFDKRATGHTLFLQYTDTDGKVYSYISYKMTLDTIVTRYLLYGNVEV